MRQKPCECWSSVAQGEFELIRRYFGTPELNFAHDDVLLGPGDDAAIVSLPAGFNLVMSIDTLNESVHFPAQAEPFLLAQRCLLVNLSDLAAMGAEPVAFTLAISLPSPDARWLAAFSQGLAAVAQAYKCPLIGGDTTRGPLSITIQAHGKVPTGKALLRSGAAVGDAVYVTGELGDGAAALWWLLADGRLNSAALDNPARQMLKQAFYQPDARISAGIALRGLASAALDISDGLASDLAHVLEASAGKNADVSQTLGAVIDPDVIPLSDTFLKCVPKSEQLALALSGGDDYELCVCVPPAHESAALAAMEALGIRFTRIGQIDQGVGIRLQTLSGQQHPLSLKGYNHFSDQL
ncbi:MAG: thiamine-phosphate kinase [Pseudohongiella sp.]|nr:thiamine-phosphate kinase [Pseudohongiella sp.]